MPMPTITVYKYNLPPHDLSRRPQLPADILTIMRVLVLPEDGELATPLCNYLLDYNQIERKALVRVCNPPLVS